MAKVPSDTNAWWKVIPINSTAYISSVLSNPAIESHTLVEVGFDVAAKRLFSKKEPGVKVEQSPAGDDLMALFSRTAQIIFFKKIHIFVKGTSFCSFVIFKGRPFL